MFSEPQFHPEDDYYSIEAAIRTGDLAYAREMLRDMIQTSPTAEVWYLAALVATDVQQHVGCLKKALELDPDHVRARRALQQAKSQPTVAASQSLLARLRRVF
jgi:hypothetical protein